MTDNKGKPAIKAPSPAPMPVNREEWSKQLNLSNFVNTYYQYRDLQSLENCRRILIVGPGQGLDTNVLKWRGYEVVTFDIDDTFKPDYLGSVHDLNMFSTGDFDAVIASHVLEHLAEPYLQCSFQQLARVARYALIYLPVHGRHFHLRFVPGIKSFDWSFILDLANPFTSTDGLTARYMANQHFWEIGIKGYRISDIKNRMSEFFEVMSIYRNRDWIPSQNFILKSKICGP